MTKLNKRWTRVSAQLQTDLTALKSIGLNSLTDYTKRGQTEEQVALHLQTKLYDFKKVVVEEMKRLEEWRKEGDEQVQEIVDKF